MTAGVRSTEVAAAVVRAWLSAADAVWLWAEAQTAAVQDVLERVRRG